MHEIVYDDNDDGDSEDLGATGCIDRYFLGSVDCFSDDESWIAALNIYSTDIDFKLDKGADNTVISEKTYISLTQRPALKYASSMLISPGGKLDS